MSLLYLSLLSRIIESMTSRQSTPTRTNLRVRENADSPAVTCDSSFTMESPDILSQRLEELKDLNFQNIDPSELENFAVAMCMIRGVDYTPQHAQVFDEFLQHFKDSAQSLCSNPRGFLQGIPDFVNEIWSTEKATEIRSRFCNIEHRSENESESKPENSTMAVTSEIDVGNENESTPTDVYLGQASADEGMEGCAGGKDLNSYKTATFQGHQHVTQSEIPLAELSDVQSTRQRLKGSFPFSSWFTEEQIQAFVEWMLEEKAEDLFLFLDTLKPIEEQTSLSTEGSQKRTQEFSMDIVPAIRARGWPKVAREWINRKRKWPSPDIIRRILQEGFHLVVKPPKRGGCSETDFRLSFSHAEYLLSQELNDIQRQCYRGLKKYYRVYLRTESKCLVTYHMKTIFLKTCEETGTKMWTEENRTTCMMKLLGNLHNALAKKYLSHFFITACNLLDMENIETLLLLESLAVKVEQFMRNPVEFSPELIPAQGTRRPLNEEAMAKQGKDVEASTETTLPRSDPKQCGLPATKNEENKASSSQEQSSRTKSGTAKDTIRMHGSRETSTTPLEGARFRDLKDLYIRTCLQLLTTAVEDGSTEELDPLERSLVDNIRELISDYSFHPEKLMEEFESRWHLIYQRMFLNCEFNSKQAMLAAMKNDIKLIKHKVLGDGVLGSPRDYSLLFPVDAFVNVYGRMKRMLSSVEPKQPTVKMDDIPLD